MSILRSNTYYKPITITAPMLAFLNLMNGFKIIRKHDELVNYYYNNLNEHERGWFLGFSTIDSHEFTHHIDFMTTPFGVNFHRTVLEEYVALQQFASELLKFPDIITSGMKLLDFDDLTKGITASYKLIKSWHLLKAKLMFFDAYFGPGKKVESPAIYGLSDRIG